MKEAIEALRRWALGGRSTPQGAQTGGTDTEGGFAVGEQLTALLAGYSDEGSAMRRICNPVQVETGAGVPFGILGALPAAQYRDENEAAEVNPDIALTGGVLEFDMLTSKIVAISRELLQDSGVNLEAELLGPLAIAWGLKANNAYTNADAQAPKTQGITESAILADYAAGTAVGSDALETADALRAALPRAVRSGAIFMGAQAASLTLRRAAVRRYPGAQVGADLPIEINDDLAGVVTLNNNGYDISAITAKTSLLYGNIGRFYRIYDAGPFIVERFEDGDYLAKSLVGLRIKRRTTGRLIGPARCVIYAS